MNRGSVSGYCIGAAIGAWFCVAVGLSSSDYGAGATVAALSIGVLSWFDLRRGR